jgi:hypothetical protein
MLSEHKSWSQGVSLNTGSLFSVFDITGAKIVYFRVLLDFFSFFFFFELWQRFPQLIKRKTKIQ